MRAVWFVPMLLGLAESSPSQITKVRGGYLFRAHYTKGMVIHDTMINSVSGAGPSPTKFPIRVTTRVLDVNGAVARLEMKMEAITVGKTVVTPVAKLVALMDDRNQVIGGTAAAPNATKLPAKPLKPGDVWTAEMPMSMGQGTMKLQGKYRFVCLSVTGGQAVAVVTYTLTGPAEGSGTETLLLRDGIIYSNVCDLKLAGVIDHMVLTRS